MFFQWTLFLYQRSNLKLIHPYSIGSNCYNCYIQWSNLNCNYCVDDIRFWGNKHKKKQRNIMNNISLLKQKSLLEIQNIIKEQNYIFLPESIQFRLNLKWRQVWLKQYHKLEKTIFSMTFIFISHHGSQFVPITGHQQTIRFKRLNKQDSDHWMKINNSNLPFYHFLCS